ncbi:hypothetical protein MUP51_07545 [Candidatus Bathyarchaeota archaeon]|jgi:hypothetical protein|nr:hypothetical protein [Candidatus Bathyarchaeota archaeon]TFH13704.1 MAG: hypothetical protein E4H04_11510 [Candidatus Bathyarchaeota archaeon]
MKFTYMPAKELVILEMVEYTLEELAQTSALIQDTGRPVILNWAEGIVFHHSPIPFTTKELLKERKDGRIYWASVIFAVMPEHAHSLKIGPRDIPILPTPNALLKRAAKWIKENRKSIDHCP